MSGFSLYTVLHVQELLYHEVFRIELHDRWMNQLAV